MCMTFVCNPQINICHFFAARTYFFGLKQIETRFLVNATRSTFLPESFCNLASVFKGLKLCMRFSSNPQIIFCHCFRSLNLLVFLAQLPNI